MQEKPKTDITFKTLAIIGAYLICQAVADITAVKTVKIGAFTLQAGTLVYAVTFTLIDLINDSFGKKTARRLAVVAAINNIFMAGYFWFAVRLPWVAGVPQGAFETMLLGIPRIVAASILAEVTAGLTDIEVFHIWKKKVGGGRWLRVMVSNAVSSGVDSVLFVTMAFWGTGIPIFASIKGQYVYKVVVALVSMPLIYLVRPKKVE